MTKASRADKLIRLAWLAHQGRLCVGSDIQDVEAIHDHIEEHVMEAPMDQSSDVPYRDRFLVSCRLFASAALSEAARLGGEP